MEDVSLPSGIVRVGSAYRVRRWVGGQRVQKRFKTLEEALSFLEALDERKALHRHHDTRLEVSTKVADLVDRWFASHRMRLQPGTEFDYEQRIHRDISKIAHYYAVDLIRDPSILHDFYWNQLGAQSARNARTILMQAFEEAVMRKLIPENPAKGQKLPPTRKAGQGHPNLC